MADSSSATGLEGQLLTKTFSPTFVILSYLVSWIGAWTTLELINKRTAGRGLYNWYLLVGSSVAMGGISIFSMHYLGNRAIVLGNGDIALQVAYNPAYMTLSMFVPIVALLGAFTTVGSNEKVSWLRVSVGGTLVGCAILSMHFLGQAGIWNYSVEYQVGNVVGSGIISVGATIAALSVFFLLRATWRASWWKRALTALLLAGAVSSMHWVAELGTKYRLKEANTSTDMSMSRNSTVIVVIVLSVTACVTLITFSLLAQKRRAQSANRAEQVVLAAAIFDQDGNLLVTPEGLLPSQKITNTYMERSFDDIFGISHPVFLWIFRTSRNWSAISGLLSSMRNHINHTSMSSGSRSKPIDLKLGADNGEPLEDYSIIFRELFCVAAAELADQLNQPLENAGVLFDEILSTGQNGYKARNRQSTSGLVDLERAAIEPQLLGRGQLLFLTKRASSRDAENLQNAGYRFAGIHNVVDNLARSMQVNIHDLTGQLINMRNYAQDTSLLEPGVHIAYFAIRASISGGFDVLVPRKARSQLPTMQLPFTNLDKWQIDFLSEFDGLSVTECLKGFKSKLLLPGLPHREEVFARQFQNTLQDFRDEINDPSFLEALLVADTVSAPCRGIDEDSNPGQALLISFRSIVPIHSRFLDPKFEYTPLSFFKIQQHVYKNSPDHAVFARRIHREFGPILNQAHLGNSDKEAGLLSPNSFRWGGSNRSLSDKDVGLDIPQNFELKGSRSLNDVRIELEHQLPTLIPRAKLSEPRMSFKFWNHHSKSTEPSNSSMRDDTSSERDLVENSPFGGILVSQEVTVDVQVVESDVATKGAKTGLETLNLGARRGVEAPNRLKLGPLAAASTETEDPETYVDNLFAICVETR